MLDVHAPHDKMHGLKDFLLHLFTITVGLLIALSLEGCVEWRHHRHLVQEAEEGLRGEIAQNEKSISYLRQQIEARQKELNGDLSALDKIRAHPTEKHESTSFTFSMRGFDDVAWRTVQTTGAFAYMPYNEARIYSDIYATQDEVYKAERQTVDDVIRAASFVSTRSDDWQPTVPQIDEIEDRIGALRMRLMLLSSLVDSLEKSYQKFQAEHH